MHLQLYYLRLYKLSRDIYFPFYPPPKRKKGKKGEEREKREINQLGEEL